MLGSALGNVVGTLYFLLYQFAGVLIAFTVFKRENRWFKVLFGSAEGYHFPFEAGIMGKKSACSREGSILWV